MEQPYNCTTPGHLFVGYTRLLTEIQESLKNGNSFALIGGRRCGKTSFLIKLQERLKADGLAGYQVRPHLFSIQQFEYPTVGKLFKHIYDQATKGCLALKWPDQLSQGVYQTFLKLMDKSRQNLTAHRGSNWLCVLLIDELDAALKSFKEDDTFFQNLRNLLMDSRYRHHFRLVASGTARLDRQISSGSSPLNNLRHKYLRILPAGAARKMIEAGFEDDYEEEHLFKLTGRHPYLLQGVLEKLWLGRPHSWDELSIKTAAEEFLKEHKDFNHWFKHFGAAEKDVYNQLIRSKGVKLSINELKTRVDGKNRSRVPEAILALSYHGVIDDSDSKELEIAGTLFENWFREHFETDDAMKVDQNTQPPNTDSDDIRQRADMAEIENIMDQILHMIREFKKEIQKLPIDDDAKHNAENALNRAVSELTQPVSGDLPEENRLKAALDESTQILKAAGTTTKQLSTFIDGTQGLVEKLGKIIKWLWALV